MRTTLGATCVAGLLSLLLAPAATVSTAAAERGTCDGKAATLVYPTIEGQASTITGTNLDDVILTGAGTERVRSLQGDDTVCTGAGKDTVYGGRGDDKLFGGGNRDILYGQRGLDRARGGLGFDVCRAERRDGCES